MHRLRSVGPTFVDTAPKRYVFEATIDATPADVFKALSAPASTWVEWFPSVTRGGFEGEPPYGLGTGRWVRASLTDFRETIVEWDEPTRFTYRIEETSRPVAAAMVERWDVEPAGTGSRVRWTMALEPKLLFRLGVPAPGVTMRPIFRRAMKNLEARLR